MYLPIIFPLLFHRLLYNTPAGTGTTYWPLCVGRAHQCITQWVWRRPRQCSGNVTRPVTGTNEPIAKHSHVDEFESDKLDTRIRKYVNLNATKGYLFYAYFLLLFYIVYSGKQVSDSKKNLWCSFSLYSKFKM